MEYQVLLTSSEEPSIVLGYSTIDQAKAVLINIEKNGGSLHGHIVAIPLNFLVDSKE